MSFDVRVRFVGSAIWDLPLTKPILVKKYPLRAPGSENLDATLAKSFAIAEKFRFQLRADTFNTLNHTNLGGFVNTINTPATFGRLTQATARTMPLGARITF